MNALFTLSERALRSCLPDERQTRLLQFCLSTDPLAARAAWKQWISQVDLNHLETASSRLLPFAAQRLAALRIPHAEAPRLAGVLRHAWANNLMLRHQLGPVLSILKGAGIPSLLLKGAPLAFSIYANPGMRPMDDIDILVPLARAREAISLLHAAGGEFTENPPSSQAPGERSRLDPLLFQHGIGLKMISGLHIDLHWFALADCCYHGADDAFWQRQRPLPGIPETAQLSAEDMLLHLCIHGMRANPISSIRWIADAFLLLRSQASFDWNVLLGEARRRRLIVPLRHALNYLAESFAAPIPAEFIASLRSQPSTLLERAAHHGNVSARMHSQFAATWLRYRRNQPQRGSSSALMHFPAYLRQAWGRIGYGAVLSHILLRCFRRRPSESLRVDFQTH